MKKYHIIDGFNLTVIVEGVRFTDVGEDPSIIRPFKAIKIRSTKNINSFRLWDKCNSNFDAIYTFATFVNILLEREMSLYELLFEYLVLWRSLGRHVMSPQNLGVDCL